MTVRHDLKRGHSAGTEILWTLIHDPHSEEKVVNLEASRRLGTGFKVSLERRAYTDTGDPLRKRNCCAGPGRASPCSTASG